MQYEAEPMYTFETMAFLIYLYDIFFYQMIMMLKCGTGQNFFITANSL